jgi:hypothetical protein
MSALSALLMILASLFSPVENASNVAMSPSDYCSPIVWDEGPDMYHSPAYLYTADEAEWDALLGMGWVGHAGDGMEALYPADCLPA